MNGFHGESALKHTALEIAAVQIAHDVVKYLGIETRYVGKTWFEIVMHSLVCNLSPISSEHVFSIGRPEPVGKAWQGRMVYSEFGSRFKPILVPLCDPNFEGLLRDELWRRVKDIDSLCAELNYWP